jgi:anti-anti-sigma factor
MMLADRALAGVSGGDHVCCAFGSEVSQQALVGRFARDALVRGERLLYMADVSDEATVRGFLDVAAVDSERWLASGQLRICPAGDVYGGDRGFDPERQIARFEAEKRQARADGFTGLAAMAEMGWALADSGLWDSVVAYEREVSRIFAGPDLRGICLYDQRLFAPDALDEAIAAHALAVGLDEECSRATWMGTTIVEHSGHPGLHLSGELDFAASPYVAARLAEHLPESEEIVVDARGLSFVDVSGCRALVETAVGLKPPRRMVLTSSSPALRRVLDLCGWNDIPQLEVRSDDAPEQIGAADGLDASEAPS